MTTSDERYAPTSDEDLVRLVKDNPLAWIVSGEGERFRASLMPVRPWKTEHGRIVQFAGHLPRHNDQVGLLRENPEANLLLLGPHAYLSPSPVANRTWTPTWNFASARCRVEIVFVEDPAMLRSILADLVDAMEAGREKPWRIEEMGRRYAELSARIIGFIAHVRDTRERYKLGQDEPEDVYADLLGGLESEGHDELVEWMKRFNPGKGFL